MTPPLIDHNLIAQSISTARMLQLRYRENLNKLNQQLEQTDRETKATEALINLLDRSDARRQALRSSELYGEAYINALKNDGESEPHERFLHTLQSRKQTLEKLCMESSEALEILEQDLKDLEILAHAHFKADANYFSILSHDWLLSCRWMQELTLPPQSPGRIVRQRHPPEVSSFSSNYLLSIDDAASSEEPRAE